MKLWMCPLFFFIKEESEFRKQNYKFLTLNYSSWSVYQIGTASNVAWSPIEKFFKSWKLVCNSRRLFKWSSARFARWIDVVQLNLQHVMCRNSQLSSSYSKVKSILKIVATRRKISMWPKKMRLKHKKRGISNLLIFKLI